MISNIRECKAVDCYYNRDSNCHANAILVGGMASECETFFASDQKTKEDCIAQVGACHVEDCKYNTDLHCKACGDIEVSKFECGARCATSIYDDKDNSG